MAGVITMAGEMTMSRAMVTPSMPMVSIHRGDDHDDGGGDDHDDGGAGHNGWPRPQPEFANSPLQKWI
jgi:hypothetical protein